MVDEFHAKPIPWRDLTNLYSVRSSDEQLSSKRFGLSIHNPEGHRTKAQVLQHVRVLEDMTENRRNFEQKLAYSSTLVRIVDIPALEPRPICAIPNVHLGITCTEAVEHGRAATGTGALNEEF